MSEPIQKSEEWLKSRELAEVLLRELPDMKDEIEMELQIKPVIIDVLRPAEKELRSMSPKVEKKVPKLVIKKHITADDDEEAMMVMQQQDAVLTQIAKPLPTASTLKLVIPAACLLRTQSPTPTSSVVTLPLITSARTLSPTSLATPSVTQIAAKSLATLTTTHLATTNVETGTKLCTGLLDELRRFRLAKKRAAEDSTDSDSDQSKKPVEKLSKVEQEWIALYPPVETLSGTKSTSVIEAKTNLPETDAATDVHPSMQPIDLQKKVIVEFIGRKVELKPRLAMSSEETAVRPQFDEQKQMKEIQEQLKRHNEIDDEQLENQSKKLQQFENHQEAHQQQLASHQLEAIQQQQQYEPQVKQLQKQPMEIENQHQGNEVQQAEEQVQPLNLQRTDPSNLQQQENMFHQQPKTNMHQQAESLQQQKQENSQEQQQATNLQPKQPDDLQQQEPLNLQQKPAILHQDQIKNLQQQQPDELQQQQPENLQQQQPENLQQQQSVQQQTTQQELKINQHHNDTQKQQPNATTHFSESIQGQSLQKQQQQIPVVDLKKTQSSTADTTPILPPEQLTPAEETLDKKLRSSCATFLQHLPCFKLQDSVPKCRECRRRSVGERSDGVEIYCRFYEFRRLKYDSDGALHFAGFPNPFTDPTPADISVWQPDSNTEPTAGYMDIQVCRYILLHAGDQFCYLWRQEAEALKLHENTDTTIAWKKAVQGIREICDVCDTTLFNYHWTCDKCGFSVCLNCFKDRKEKRTSPKQQQRGRDEYHWLLCSAQHQQHEQRLLILTQIIAGDALNVLGRLMHEVRMLWQVPQKCGCLLSKQQLPQGSALMATVQDMIKESQLKQRTSASSLATEATLRHQAQMEKLHVNKLEFARARGLDYVPGRQWNKKTLGKDHITSAFDNFEHINFHRKGLAGLRRFLPPRAMTLAYSTQLAPGVAHEWLCDGKLLRLTDPMHPDNRILFEEVWKCGQPVMISEVARSLNLDLWRPEAFCRDFGDKPNDLINCLNGNLVPNQPMRHFWEGFQCIKKRLLDAHGNPMLLKLKDWPPGDDFAEIMPTRYSDLMKGLPMPEYTLRTGNLNIASCLPKMFVPPDLGPKMYNAYGSALHPDKGTTNLHLDISDAVNIMVYVGIPQDADGKSQLAATQRAIAMGGCDYLTRVRCLSPKVLPGALWHIFPARDADKIRDLLNRVTLEKGFRLEPDHDPIHDQNWYLDDKLRARLFKEYSVEGYPIVQCLGDAVFIPAGAPHQVQNLHNCIKVAEDFVSPENITHCYHLTHEFRQLSHSHTNHEDKLQIKNIIYHAIKDCCTILVRALEKRTDELSAESRSVSEEADECEEEDKETDEDEE